MTFKRFLPMIFWLILSAVCFWVVFYSSIFSSNSAIYFLRSNYYSLFRRFTKPQTVDQIISNIRVSGFENNKYQYLFVGKFSNFDFVNKVIYLTSTTNKVYGFRLPVGSDLQDKTKIYIAFVDLDDTGAVKLDSKGKTVKKIETFNSDASELGLSFWYGKNVWVFWKDAKKIKEMVDLSNINSSILVNDSKLITEMMRSNPRTKK